MDHLGTLAVLAGVLALSVISPGPNFVIVTSTAVAVSRQAGFMAGLGLAAASFTWTLLTVVGLGVIILHVGWIYTAVRVAGAAYLIWIGAKMVLGARTPMDASPAMPVAGNWAPMRKAYLVSMTNPKSAAFYGSIFAVMVPVHAPVWIYAVIVAMATGLSALWYCGMALLFSNAIVRRAFLRVKSAFETVMGLCLMGLGGRLLASR